MGQRSGREARHDLHRCDIAVKHVTEVAGQTHGRVRADSAPLAHDVVDSRRRHVKRLCERVHGQASGQQLLALAQRIQADIFRRFAVELEIEPNVL